MSQTGADAALLSFRSTERGSDTSSAGEYAPAKRRLARRAAVAWLIASSLPATGTTASAQDDHRPRDVASSGEPYSDELNDASRTFAIPLVWLRAIIRAESAGDPIARSSKGAIGLMQLMPATYADMRQQLALGADPFRPMDNILAGAGYLRQLIDRYGATGALAAYNAGPRRYERWLSGEAPLPSETRAFVARVRWLLESPGDKFTVAKRIANPVSPRSAPLFATLSGISDAPGLPPQPGSVPARDASVAQRTVKVEARPTDTLFASISGSGAR